MAIRKSYRHKVTGLVSELDPITARGMGSLIEEVRDGAKPLVPLKKLVSEKPRGRATKKEQKDD